MNPQAYSIFDSNGNYLACGVVNNAAGPYINIAQVLTDGKDGNTPVVLGGQIAVKAKDVLDFSKPLGTNDTTTQWVPEADLLLNTPRWPDLTLKYQFKFVPSVLIGVLPVNAFPAL